MRWESLEAASEGDCSEEQKRLTVTHAVICKDRRNRVGLLVPRVDIAGVGMSCVGWIAFVVPLSSTILPCSLVGQRVQLELQQCPLIHILTSPAGIGSCQ